MKAKWEYTEISGHPGRTLLWQGRTLAQVWPSNSNGRHWVSVLGQEAAEDKASCAAAMRDARRKLGALSRLLQVAL